MFKPFDATEITKSDRRTSKTTLQEENDIKNTVAVSSSKLELGFHLEIHQNLCRYHRQYLQEENRRKKRRHCRPA
jgi:hypothetical protein